MSLFLRILIIVLGIIAGLFLIGWIGFQVKPQSFAPFAQKTPDLQTVPIPDGLPAPVDRFYHKVYGDRVPVITSAVITGKASLRPVGPFMLPGRFRFIHVAGQDYRHYIEVTFFGIPIMQVNERYVDQKSLAELPFGRIDNDPKQNQGANLGLWAESAMFPAIFLTDPRVQWKPVDDSTALLVVPFEDDKEETFVVRFDPQTALITYLESMRYHGPESTSKTLWVNENREWKEVNGIPFMTSGAAIWMDDGKPWAIFNAEDVVFNADVSEYVRAKGQ